MPTKSPLGRLTPVTLREAWESEAGDFTPWLAEEENIQLLGDTIGIDLEVEATEKNVGMFRADILCKDGEGKNVLIENQLERTDHTHLGQLITYAAGLETATIIWISQNFREEHRAALDWLNSITSEEVRFFGVQIELWRIGDSAIAPKFHIISSPNDWSKSVSSGARALHSDAQLRNIKFWTQFSEFLQSPGNESRFRPSKPAPQNSTRCAFIAPGVSLQGVAALWDNEMNAGDNNVLRAEVCIDGINAPYYFEQLLANRGAIETELGETLNWYQSEGVRQKRIHFRKSIDFEDESKWPEYHEWLRIHLDRLYSVFSPRLKSLVSEKLEPTDEAPNHAQL